MTYIQNNAQLAINENRKLALDIAEVALEAIDTNAIILSSISLDGEILRIQDQSFDLGKFKKIKVIGFGKASCEAAHALEKILGSKIDQGIVVGLKAIKCDYIDTFVGAHPMPTFQNIEVGRKIFEMCSNSTKDDLVIVIVSGGGSSLLCWPEEECEQEIRLYEASTKQGENINELNIIRKHISHLKGGGLAQLLYPATVIGLIFSDVPGNHFENVASGPTYKDVTTISDAQKLIDKYALGDFNLIETPKEDKFFENVSNFVLVSNTTALEAMKKKAENLGFSAEIISSEMYDETNAVLQKIFEKRKNNTVVLAGGEPRVMVDKTGGSGGRCLHMGIKALDFLDKSSEQNSVFISLASDGIDNSPGAGVIVDKYTLAELSRQGLDRTDYMHRFDSYVFFEKIGGIIFTGPTNANVSDLMILLTK